MMSCLRPARRTEAHARLARAATALSELPQGRSPRAYALRHGVAHALAARQAETARGLLTDFAWLQARFGELPDQAPPLVQDAGATLQRLPADVRPPFLLWEAFFRERVHLLRRVDTEWPANRILLQLAVEHADDSPVTRAAEAWLGEGTCDWLWLRRAKGQRAEKAAPSACLWVLEGHMEAVRGACIVGPNRLASWSFNSMRMWDLSTGAQLASLDGWGGWRAGATQLGNRCLIAWCEDKTLLLLDEHLRPSWSDDLQNERDVVGMTVLRDGRFFSWHKDGRLCIRRAHDGRAETWLLGHAETVRGALELRDGVVVTWSDDGTFRLWNVTEARCEFVCTAHHDFVNGVLALKDERLVSWSDDHTIRVWVPFEEQPVHTFGGHAAPVRACFVLPGGTVVSWSDDDVCLVWELESGVETDRFDLSGDIDKLPLEVQARAQSLGVRGTVVLPGQGVLTWSHGPSLYLWRFGAHHPVKICEPHIGGVIGVSMLRDGRVMSWSYDHTVCVWDPATGASSRLQGHAHWVSGALEAPDGSIVSWSPDGHIRCWDLRLVPTSSSSPAQDTRWWTGGTLMSNGNFVSRSGDGSLAMWSTASGKLLARADGHGKEVNGLIEVQVRERDCLLSCGDDGAIRAWCSRTLALLATWTVDERRIMGMRQVAASRLVAWNDDGTLYMLDTGRGCVAGTARSHLKAVAGVACLADGEFVSWSEDGKLCIWKCDAMNLVRLIVGTAGIFPGARFIDHERLAFWAGPTLSVWDYRSGHLLHSWGDHEMWVTNVCVLDEARLASQSRLGTIYVWDLRYGILVSTAEPAQNWKTTGDLERRFYRDAFPTCVVLSVRAVGVDGMVRALFDRQVNWHADGSWTADHLLPDGTLVATCDKHLAILHLHHGNRRVTIEEAEAMAVAPSAVHT